MIQRGRYDDMKRKTGGCPLSCRGESLQCGAQHCVLIPTIVHHFGTVHRPANYHKTTNQHHQTLLHYLQTHTLKTPYLHTNTHTVLVIKTPNIKSQMMKHEISNQDTKPVSKTPNQYSSLQVTTYDTKAEVLSKPIC